MLLFWLITAGGFYSKQTVVYIQASDSIQPTAVSTVDLHLPRRYPVVHMLSRTCILLLMANEYQEPPENWAEGRLVLPETARKLAQGRPCHQSHGPLGLVWLATRHDTRAADSSFLDECC